MIGYRHNEVAARAAGGCMNMTGAQAMVKALLNEGVRVVFGYPGAAVCPFLDELAAAELEFILIRQEQNAGHAASGYARMTGRPGVCLTTSGPGATNLITGIATAYMDSIPMVAITGQVRSDLVGRDVFQEADITGASEPFCKHSYLIQNVSDLPRVFKEAFYIASTGRPGPVLIDIPIDIQTAELDFEYPEKVEIKGYKPSYKGHALQIRRVAAAIEQAKRPVICAGGGIFASKAETALRQFAEHCNIPVVTTMMGIGALPTAHPLHLGMLGTHGRPCANRAIHEADMLIIAGARVGDRAMARPDQIAARAQVVHIDIDPAEIGKNIEAEIPIVGDVRVILEALCEKTKPGDTAEWLKTVQALRDAQKPPRKEKPGFVEPLSFVKLLTHEMADDAVLVADVGQNQIWSANYSEIRQGRFLTSGGLGTMGYAIPAALGVLTAQPGRQTVAVCGDGSFQMAQMELATLIQQGAPLKIVIMRNDRLGMVRELQTRQYKEHYIATTLKGSPDFIALAAAYGIPGERLCENAGAQDAVRRLLSAPGPYVLECAVDPLESSILD